MQAAGRRYILRRKGREQMPQVQNIQWFPGHMAKTRRLMREMLPLVDLAAEVIDARIPYSSRNPELDELLQKKPRIVLLNKSDMADENVTARWVTALEKQHALALPVDCKSGKGLSEFLPAVRSLLSARLEQYRSKGMTGRTLRVMVVGIPNAGKSSFINRMAGSGRAKVENRPGVTRGNQWFLVAKGIELLDTPGVLWPKFEDPNVGDKLAFTGGVKDQVVDIELLAMRLLSILAQNYPQMLADRYRMTETAGLADYELLELLGKKRGMLMRGGEVDTLRAATTLLDEFRAGKLGRLSFEAPPTEGERADDQF